MYNVPKPVFRRLRGYAFDPSLSIQLDTALINETVFKVCWEETLLPGPVGEYLEIVDFDPASQAFYAPVDLNNPDVLAQDGLQPSESSPQFHQQMVYAVAMKTIENFEKALGRKALWSSYRDRKEGDFIRRLRIYPHALRDANAYYSPAKKALMFGYFPASADDPGSHPPDGIVFTCLSHDIIAHETTHALLDGMHRRFIEANHRDSLAFHEAFADIVALFQHFSFPEVLENQIAKTRGDLASQNLLGQLAQQFGMSIGNYGALRDAIGEIDKETRKWKPLKPNPEDYQTVTEPHERGAILVAAVFDAFLAIYKRRVADLHRIASEGTGILRPGELHPDLVKRLAKEAAKTAQHILSMCIRALDYCPPVDVSFGDYLRALITADTDLVPDDDLGYRIAMIEAFKRRGIYPRDIRTLSVESLCWRAVSKHEQHEVFSRVAAQLREFVHSLSYLDEYPKRVFSLASKPGSNEPFYGVTEDGWAKMGVREKTHYLTLAAKIALNRALKFELAVIESMLANPALKDEADELMGKFEELTGLYFFDSRRSRSIKPSWKADEKGRFKFEVHSMRAARRVGPSGNTLNQVIISITQQREVPLSDNSQSTKFTFRGGCTLIVNLEDLSVRWVIKKPIDSSNRVQWQREYRTGSGATASLRATYFGKTNGNGQNEPFALLHRSL